MNKYDATKNMSFEVRDSINFTISRINEDITNALITENMVNTLQEEINDLRRLVQLRDDLVYYESTYLKKVGYTA